MINNRSDDHFLLYMASAMLGLSLFFLPGSIGPWRYSTIYWLIGFPFLRYLQKKYDDLLHPAGPLLILTFLYSIPSILIYYDNGGITNYGDAVSGKSFILFCAACILGELGIIAGAIIAARHSENTTVYRTLAPGVIRAATPVMFVLAAALAILSFNNIISSFDFFHAKSYSEWALSSRVVILESAASSPIVKVLTQMGPVTLLLASGILLTFKRQFILRFIGVGILAANLFTSLLSGGRGGVFGTLCAIAIFVHYRIKKIKAPIMILGIFVSMLLLNGIALVRSTAKLSEMYDIFTNATGGNITSLLNLSSSGELVVGMNLMKLIEAISSGESKFNYGKGFVNDILCYVPRAIYPNRPLPLSERFVEDFYPGIRDKGGGYGLFFLQDGYWAFGLLGVLISMILYSWALSRIYLYVKNSFDSDFIVLIYAFMYFPLVISSPRSGLLLSFKAAAMNALPFLLVLMLSSIALTLSRKRSIEPAK